jgi:hypothetical protein
MVPKFDEIDQNSIRTVKPNPSAAQPPAVRVNPTAPTLWNPNQTVISPVRMEPPALRASASALGSGKAKI